MGVENTYKERCIGKHEFGDVIKQKQMMRSDFLAKSGGFQEP